LIAVDVELDTGPTARQRSNGSRVAPVKQCARIALDNVAGVVTSAVETAVAKQLRCGLVSTDLLRGRPEVVDRVLLVGKKVTIRDENVVDAHSQTRVGDVERVVESGLIVGVAKAIQVPVSLGFVSLTLYYLMTIALLTWEVSMMGVFLVVASATILMFQVYGLMVYVT
jgi:hypothetical protein